MSMVMHQLYAQMVALVTIGSVRNDGKTLNMGSNWGCTEQ